MAQNGFDPDAVAQDHDFLAANTQDKIAYLSAQDKDFAAAKPQDQIAYIQHLTEGQRNAAVPPPPTGTGFLPHALDVVGNLAKAAFATGFGGSGDAPITYYGATGAGKYKPAGIDDTTWDNMTREQRVAAIKAAPDVPSDWQQRKAAGYGVPYRIAAPIAEQTGVVNVPATEHAASIGDTGGVLGETLPAAGVALSQLPEAVTGKSLTERAANRLLPPPHQAGAGLNMLTDTPEGAFAQRPISTPNTNEVTGKVQTELANTEEQPHELVQTHINREARRSLPPDDPNALGPMTFLEARTVLKRVNAEIEARKGWTTLVTSTDKVTLPQLKRYADALSTDISEAASREGFGADYENMKNDYRKGMVFKRAMDLVGVPAFGALGYKMGAAVGEPIGGAILGGMVGKQVGKGTIGRITDAILDREAGPPKLQSIPSTPEAYQRAVLSTDTKRMQAQRITLDAKEGRISPQEEIRRLQKLGVSVKTNPVPKSPPRRNQWAYQTEEPPF